MHYAWVICGCSAVLLFCNMGICYNLMSAYLPYIQADGLHPGVASSLISVRCLAGVLAMLVLPAYFRRFSYRTGLALSLVLAAVSSVLYAFAGSATLYYIASLFSGFAFGLGTTAPTTILLSRWFREKYGTALGICSTGSSFALILLPPVVTTLATKYGLAVTFLVQALFLLLMAALVFLLLRDTPKDMGLSPFGNDGETAAQRILSTHSATPLCLALLLTAMAALGGAGGTIPGHFSILFQTTGYSAERSAFFLSFFGICMALSKIGLGIAADRIGTRPTVLTSVAMMSVGCAMALLLDGSVLRGILFTLTLGLGFGVTSVGISLLAADFSSEDSYARNVKDLQVSLSVGSIIIATLPGVIYDRTGEYRTAFLLLCTFGILTLLLLIASYRLHRKQIAHFH